MCTGNTGPVLLSIIDVCEMRTCESSGVLRGNDDEAADVGSSPHALEYFGKRTGSSGILLACDEDEAEGVWS